MSDIAYILEKLIVIPPHMQTEDEAECVKYMVGDICTRNDDDGVNYIIE